MVTWLAFSQLQPGAAGEGRSLLYQHGVGLAFLATVRRDGRPRVHPMCPLLTDDGLFAFIVPSPKQADLRRTGAYAMHSFPCPTNEDAFYVMGQAELVTDPIRREALATQFVAERSQIGVAPPSAEDALFEFDIDSTLLTKTSGHGDPTPDHRIWHAGRT
jgi:Pyridoxamine 5'-phosphate oxidase